MATSTSTYANPYISLQIYDNTEYIEEETVEERKEFNGMQVGFFAWWELPQVTWALKKVVP